MSWVRTSDIVLNLKNWSVCVQTLIKVFYTINGEELDTRSQATSSLRILALWLEPRGRENGSDLEPSLVRYVWYYWACWSATVIPERYESVKAVTVRSDVGRPRGWHLSGKLPVPNRQCCAGQYQLENWWVGSTKPQFRFWKEGKNVKTPFHHLPFIAEETMNPAWLFSVSCSDLPGGEPCY